MGSEARLPWLQTCTCEVEIIRGELQEESVGNGA